MENIYQKAFRNARIYKNFSLAQLAKPLNVSRQFIWKVEKGLRIPNVDLIKKLEGITNLSFWALVAGDFLNENQKNYVMLSTLTFNNTFMNLNEFSKTDLNYFIKKFEVEIDEIQEQIFEAKAALAKRIEKSNLSENELNILEAEVQKAKNNLSYLTSNNAPADMIADQQAKVQKTETDLADKKRKSGMISDREAFLEDITIQELEMKIELRQEKITAIKAIV